MRTPTMQETADYIIRFTETYKRHTSKTTREVQCLRVMFDYVFQPVQADDLLAGRLLYPPLGLAPEPLGGRGVCFNFEEKAFEGQRMKAIRAFWRAENTRHKIREAFPPDVAQALPHDDVYYKEYGIAFPLYRVVGIFIDYEKLLRLGINGMREWVREECPNDEMTDAFVEILDIFTDVLRRYAEHADELAQAATPERAEQLHTMRDALQNLTQHPPATFYEAMQLSFLYTLACGAYNYGRMDDYLGAFYQADIERGILNEETALAYLQSLWRLIAARASVFHGRVIIGGLGRKNEAAADNLALLCIEASRTVVEIEPQLTLRLHKNQDPRLLEAALECIAQGRTYPMLYNDDVNVPAVQKAFGVPLEEAQDYLPFGCGEYVINHKSFGSPNGIINLLKALETVLNGGYCAQSKEAMGLKSKTLAEFTTFDELLEAYKAQLTHYIEILARQQKIEYEVVAEQADFLLMSMLYDDCVQRGKPIFSGGIRYLGGTLETYGNVNTANSLTAIKKLVYDEKRISPQELRQALAVNFEGYAPLRKMLLDAPKYGNDDLEADAMAIWLHDFVCRTTMAQKDKVGLHSYLVVNINNEANTLLGKYTAASPDGRLAEAPMANANSPEGGTDTKGLTAMLNSLVKLSPDIHAGAVQNMKLSKTIFDKNRDMVRAVLATYFKKGGTQAMITVLDKGDLERAMANPEAYGHIMVRVGGFSARFVTLSKAVQEEIMSRTLY